jgi:hypothetical protein
LHTVTTRYTLRGCAPVLSDTDDALSFAVVPEKPMAFWGSI